jgi:hypothetical protein
MWLTYSSGGGQTTGVSWVDLFDVQSWVEGLRPSFLLSLQIVDPNFSIPPSTILLEYLPEKVVTRSTKLNKLEDEVGDVHPNHRRNIIGSMVRIV